MKCFEEILSSKFFHAAIFFLNPYLYLSFCRLCNTVDPSRTRTMIVNKKKKRNSQRYLLLLLPVLIFK